ncbi:MAG: hypothetical protein WCF90_10685 [Methanomicrobiales archaeon]
MINSQMTETVRYEAIITSEFISVQETSALHLFASHRNESLIGDILNTIHPERVNEVSLSVLTIDCLNKSKRS